MVVYGVTQERINICFGGLRSIYRRTIPKSFIDRKRIAIKSVFDTDREHKHCIWYQNRGFDILKKLSSSFHSLVIIFTDNIAKWSRGFAVFRDGKGQRLRWIVQKNVKTSELDKVCRFVPRIKQELSLPWISSVNAIWDVSIRKYVPNVECEARFGGSSTFRGSQRRNQNGDDDTKLPVCWWRCGHLLEFSPWNHEVAVPPLAWA